MAFITTGFNHRHRESLEISDRPDSYLENLGVRSR